MLQWHTATEIDNDFLSIEHSANDKDFSELMEIKGGGNSVLPKDYSYTHINVNAGKHFYRLTQHDFWQVTIFAGSIGGCYGKAVIAANLGKTGRCFCKTIDGLQLNGLWYYAGQDYLKRPGPLPVFY